MSASRGDPPRAVRVTAIALAAFAAESLAASPEATAAQPNDDSYPGILPGDPNPVSCPTIGFESTAPLLLAKAIDLALCNNAQIRDAWVNIRVQSAALGQAKAAYWPTLSASVAELADRTAYPDTDFPTTTRTEATVYGSLAWRLFDFGGRASSKREAEALLESAVASRDATIQKTLSAAIQAYFDAITRKAVIDNKSDDETLARATLESARRKQAQGGGAQSDTLQATTALAKVSLDKNRAIGAYEKAVATLVYVLGLPPNSTLMLPLDVDLRTGFEEEDLSAWLKQAEQRHPAILAARAAVEAARQQVTVAKASGRPTIDFTGNYYQNAYPSQGLTSTNTKVTTFGLSVTVPLFDGFATHYKVRGAEELVKSKEAELQDTEQQTLMQVVSAHADAESSFRNLRVSEDLVEAATASLESSQRRYESGAADIVELLSTQAALADAKSERVRCLAEWRTARLALLTTAGLLNRTNVLQ
jgi:outer membrane protein